MYAKTGLNSFHNFQLTRLDLKISFLVEIKRGVINLHDLPSKSDARHQRNHSHNFCGILSNCDNIFMKGVIRMSIEDKFTGAKNGFSFYFAFLSSIAEEYGMDKAIALSVKVDEKLGAEQGRMIKEQSEAAEFDTITAAAVAKNTIEHALGISSEVIEESPDKTVMRCSRCPVYEAAQDLGIDTNTVEKLCHKGSIKFMDALVKQLNPNLSYNLNKFRTSADDYCEEEIVLK
jgi:hypothetical protein